MSFRIVSDKDNGFKAFFGSLKAMSSGKSAKVGIQSPESTTKQKGITMVDLGLVHEWGATIKNGFGKGIKIVIPQRSFIRSTADVNERKYNEALAKIVNNLVDNPKSFNLTRELTILGEVARRDIVLRMTRGEITPELAESTKERRGEEGPPLVDTGLLLASITSKVS